MDGGGSRGLITTEVIRQLEEILNQTELHQSDSPVEMWQLFDLIIGKWGRQMGGVITRRTVCEVFINFIEPRIAQWDFVVYACTANNKKDFPFFLNLQEPVQAEFLQRELH